MKIIIIVIILSLFGCKEFDNKYKGLELSFKQDINQEYTVYTQKVIDSTDYGVTKITCKYEEKNIPTKFNLDQSFNFNNVLITTFDSFEICEMKTILYNIDAVSIGSFVHKIKLEKSNKQYNLLDMSSVAFITIIIKR